MIIIIIIIIIIIGYFREKRSIFFKLCISLIYAHKFEKTVNLKFEIEISRQSSLIKKLKFPSLTYGFLCEKVNFSVKHRIHITILNLLDFAGYQ